MRVRRESTCRGVKSRSGRSRLHASTMRSTSSGAVMRSLSRAVGGRMLGVAWRARVAVMRERWAGCSPRLWQTGHRAFSARGPPWCNGSTTAFGAVRSRFESWGRSQRDSGNCGVGLLVIRFRLRPQSAQDRQTPKSPRQSEEPSVAGRFRCGLPHAAARPSR